MPASGEAAETRPRASPDRPRVLVVDDDQRNLLAIRTVLEDLGDVVIARSGEEALRHLLNGEFAVILLDVFMPGMDGYETAQIIRQRRQTRGIPIIFLSAVNKEAEHLIRGYSMGAVDYVFKPVEPVVLRSKVAVFVDLFAKTREIEHKARKEQALLDANLQANSERLQIEQELRRAEQRQAAIIQSLPIVLYLEPLDCDPRCPDFVSGNLKTLTGFSFEDVRDDPSLWQTRLHPEDRERVLEAIAHRRQAGRLSVEYRWQCADGTYKQFHDQAALLLDADGRPSEFAGTLTDVTEQRLLETQLVQAQKMDALGKLTGGVAHDFNNLLAAVIGGLGLLERRASLKEEHLKILTMTKRAAEQGTDLVRRLLAFARKQKLEPASIEMGPLAEAVSELLAHTLGGRVELKWRNAKRVWCAYADQAQLELALMNLIINARDAMPDGGTIIVSAENKKARSGDLEDLPRGDYVVLSVRDNGTGMSPQLLQKVLEPFFTTKDVGKGSGLGLSMVYGFAKQSSGAFRLRSTLGEGTVAELWLPRAPAGAPAAQKRRSEGVKDRSSRTLQVLLVDDHEEVRSATAGMLEDLGHHVSESSSGVDALKTLQGPDYECDLLVSDFAMPTLAGTDLIREARGQRPGLPAVIITGYADAESISGRPEGVALLSKPFSLDELAAAIDQASTNLAAA